MKILWFSNTPAVGEEYLNNNLKIQGTGGWLYALNKELQNKLDLSVAFHYPYKKDKFQYQNTNYFPVYTGNILVENLKRRCFGKVYDDDFLDSYLNIIDEVQPDLIHIHGTENSFLCLLPKTNIPVVVSIQGNLTVYQHKYFSGFYGEFIHLKNEKLTWKSILFGRHSFYKSFNNMTSGAQIEQKNLKFAKNIIGRTDWDRRITRILAPKSKYFIGNEVLRQSFYKEQWENNYQGGKVILFTTNSNNYYKGFETVCYALNLLNNIGIDVEWRVAGVSKNSLINKITKKHLKGNYPRKGLNLLGSLDENKLIKHLKQSHFYVMPSHIENSPNNLCEAMILGMPSIATFAGGTGSMLKDGKEGILIQDGDPWAMAGAVIELLHNPEKAAEMGKRAQERAKTRHNKNEIINSLITTYEKITSEK